MLVFLDLESINEIPGRQTTACIGFTTSGLLLNRTEVLVLQQSSPRQPQSQEGRMVVDGSGDH